MALKDRLPFREALLEHRTEKEWETYRPHHLVLYHTKFNLEGKEVAGSELIAEYTSRFPADREYSVKGQFNRMLAECHVPQFSFLNQEIIRGFLLSAQSLEEWARYQPNYFTFSKTDFQYHGISIKGQMLLYNVFVELDNRENGTFYAFLDYLQRPDLSKRLERKSRNNKFVANLFNLAGIKIKSKLISEENLAPERLKEILLAKKTEEEWRKWQGRGKDFEATWFDLPGYRNFTGEFLRRCYETGRGEKCSVKDIFAEAGIAVGSDPALLQEKIERRFEYLYGLLDDPNAVRKLFLQIKSEEEWKKPQQFYRLRKERVAINRERSITLHTLLYLFSMYKHNLKQDSVDKYLGYDALKDPESTKIFKSNKTELIELLNFAGIETTFIPQASEVDLHDPDLLRRMLFHARYDRRNLSVDELNSMPDVTFRKAVFTDPSTGLELKGQSLMVYYSALYYVKEHPEIGLEVAANKLNKGRSNQAVRDEILTKAGLKKKL